MFDESNSPYTAANEALFADNTPNGGLDDYDFTTFLLHHAVNGKMYCSLTGLNADVGDRVRWHIATLVRPSIHKDEGLGVDLGDCMCGRHLCILASRWLGSRCGAEGSGRSLALSRVGACLHHRV